MTGALTRGAATRTKERQSRVSGLLSASCLLRQRPTAPMDQMPLLWQSNAVSILPTLADAILTHLHRHIIVLTSPPTTVGAQGKFSLLIWRCWA